ncbi:MAG: glycosyltransferase, partial [Thermoplasmata archaeon]|nr:glycosyltransferase [Thermoplasmata archaeon]
MRYSIVVTARKASELKELFESIEEMEFDRSSFEVVAVVEEEDASYSPNFNLKMKKTDRKGIAAGRNEGIDAAIGETVVFTDSDCKVPKNWLSLLSIYNEDAVAGNARIQYKTKFGKYVSFIGYPAGGNLGFEKVFDVENGYAMQLSTCNAAIRSKIVKSLKFDENLMGSEDK